MNVGRINYGPQFQGKLKYKTKEGVKTVDAKDIKNIKLPVTESFVVVKVNGNTNYDFADLRHRGTSEYANFLTVYMAALAAPEDTVIEY